MIDKLLFEFLERIEQDFITPLSHKVNLSEYSRKLINLAINHCCIENGELVGLVSIYCNDHISKTAYIPFVGIDRRYRGHGISKALMLSAIETARKRRFKTIGIHTENEIAINLYCSLGFEIKTEGNRTYLELLLS